MGKIRIGISGWTYEGWRNRFYPGNLPRKQELSFASRRFDTIEINGSFYSLQSPSSYKRWREETPGGFVFAIKGSRFITHQKRLRNISGPLANFFASGVLCLEEKMGPFLWQFPETFQYDRALFDDFLAQLPHTTNAVSQLAGKRDSRLSPDRVVTGSEKNRTIRHAIEVRHSSFCTDDFIALLRKHRVALVFADAPKTWPANEDLAAGFVYIRLHGATKMYSGAYPEERLASLAEKIKAWAAGGEPEDADRVSAQSPPKRKSRDVFAYFDNDQKAMAPQDACRLVEMLA